MGEIPTQHLEVMAESFRHDGLNWHYVVIRATLDGIADLRAALRDAEKARKEAERERDAYRHEWNVSSRQQGAETRARYAAESRAARLEEKVRRIQSACGLPNPAEACRVVLAIAAEREERGKEKGEDHGE